MSTTPQPVRVFTIRAENGETLTCYRRADGLFGCPICGHPLPEAPYEPGNGEPSFTWCPCCECQFGWDDRIGPRDLPGSKLLRWDELRREWERRAPPCGEEHLPCPGPA